MDKKGTVAAAPTYNNNINNCEGVDVVVMVVVLKKRSQMLLKPQRVTGSKLVVVQCCSNAEVMHLVDADSPQPNSVNKKKKLKTSSQQ